MKTAPLVAAATGLLCALSVPLFGQPKVEEFLLGPYDPIREKPTLSTTGLHVAIKVPKGSKTVWMVDGVEGPRFDTALNQLIFSSDGKRHAYVAISGTDGILVLDGKEVARAPLSGNVPPFFELKFSPGGKLFTYERHYDQGAFRQLVVEGKAGERFSVIKSLAFSPDETRYAHLAGQQSDKDGEVLVVDGRNVGKQGVDPQFSPDSKTVVTVGHTPTGSVLLMNGKAGSRAKSIRGVHMSNGGLNLLVLGTQSGNGAFGEYLGASGKKIEGSDCQKIEWLKFSPDGKRYAALCSMGPMIKYVLIDGKKGEHYQGITDFEFSPDSSRTTYTARSAAGIFRVVDGEESQSYTAYQPFTWGGGGKRFGFIGNQGTRTGDLVVDGKVAKFQNAQSLGFSPDGSRYAFLGGDAMFPSLHIDGAEQTGVAMVAPSNNVAVFAFSPDGKFIAHHGFAGNRDKRGLVANGRLVAEFSQLYYTPAFSPDSQHVFCFSQNPGGGKAFALLVNGKTVLTLDAIPFASTGTQGTIYPFEMGADGAYTFVAASGGEYKRYRVTGAANHTLAAAIADIGAAQEKSLADANAAKKKAEDDNAAAAAEKAAKDAKAKADYDAAIAARAKAQKDAADARAKAVKAAADARAKAAADAAAARAAKQKK